MIKINQIKLPVTHSDEALKKKIIKMLKLNAKTGFTYRILKKSLDARKKPELFYTYCKKSKQFICAHIQRKRVPDTCARKYTA